MTAADRVAFEERCAFLGVDGGLARADAERQALHEILDARLALTPPGIVGELVLANRRRHHPDLQDDLAASGLVGCRAPGWGFGHIVEAKHMFRFARSGEHGIASVVVPVADPDCGISDLAAQSILGGPVRVRLGAGVAVGVNNIEIAIQDGLPLMVFGSLLAWLRGGSRGAVICDWQKIGRELDGARLLHCPAALAPALHRATRRCFPQPEIFVATLEARHAA